MNIILAAALLLSVAFTIYGEDATTPTPEPTTESIEDKLAKIQKNTDAAKNAKDAVDAKSKDAKGKDAKAKDVSKSKETENSKKEKDTKDDANKKNPNMTFKKGKLKKPAPKPMNDSPATGENSDKKKDGGKEATKTAKEESGTAKSATVTVAQDTATEGNGVTSCHGAEWKMVVAMATILARFH